jgi:hypothetical protein
MPPPPTPDKLTALALAAIQDATASYLAGGSVATWRAAMGRAITTAHTAAYIAATAQRLGIPADSALISERRLSRAERGDIKAAVEAQFKYLDAFVADIRAGRLSPAQIAARANMYAPALRPFYYAMRWGEWEIPAELMPGMQTCMSNCRCSGSVIDNEDGTGIWRRVMGGGAAERHCTECPPLEGDHPITRKRAA